MQFAKNELVNIGDEIEVEKDRLLERVSEQSLWNANYDPKSCINHEHFEKQSISYLSEAITILENISQLSTTFHFHNFQ